MRRSTVLSAPNSVPKNLLTGANLSLRYAPGMIDGQQNNEPQNSPPESDPDKKDPKELTPEEQLALYEEQLKEEDWGHQPC